MVNLRELPADELDEMVQTTKKYLRKLENEKKRRDTLDNAEANLDELATAYFTALGLQPRAPWSGPSSAIEGYPMGWEVSHEGFFWTSRQAGNLEEPGEGEAWERGDADPDSPQEGSDDEDDQIPDHGDENGAQDNLVPSEHLLPGDDVLPTDNEEEQVPEEDDPDVEVVLDRGEGEDS